MLRVRIGEFRYETGVDVTAANLDAYLADVANAFRRWEHMNWTESRWCDNCGAIPEFQRQNAHNPTIHHYVCPLCKRGFEFDTWTKAAKPIDEVSAPNGL